MCPLQGAAKIIGQQPPIPFGFVIAYQACQRHSLVGVCKQLAGNMPGQGQDRVVVLGFPTKQALELAGLLGDYKVRHRVNKATDGVVWEISSLTSRLPPPASRLLPPSSHLPQCVSLHDTSLLSGRSALTRGVSPSNSGLSFTWYYLLHASTAGYSAQL